MKGQRGYGRMRGTTLARSRVTPSIDRLSVQGKMDFYAELVELVGR